MTNLYFVVFIGILFATTLYQAREIGEKNAAMKAQEVTIEFMEKINEIKLRHQAELDVKDIKNAIEVQGLKNTIIDQAANFEEKGISDPIGLSDDNTKWINDFMRRNSRNSEDPTRDLPTTEPATAGIPSDRNNDN